MNTNMNVANAPVEAPEEFVCDAPNSQVQSESWVSNLKYLFVGTLFGIVFVKAEIVSWFRIQEMFLLSHVWSDWYRCGGGCYLCFPDQKVQGSRLVWRANRFNR